MDAAKRPRFSERIASSCLLPEKGLKKVETYTHTVKDERNAEPGFSGDSHLSFGLQVTAQGNAKENDRQCHEHDSKKWKALHGCYQVVILI